MSNCASPLNRFNKPSKQLLVEMINTFNGTQLVADQLTFSDPEALDTEGKTEVKLMFRTNLGWSDEQRPMTYYRIEANRHEDLKTLVINAEGISDDASLLQAIFDQCGVLLEPSHIQIQEIYGGLDADQADITTRVTQPFLNGFNKVVEPPFAPDPDLDRNFMITFDDHLVFFGYLHVLVRPALALLGKTIARRMDFRDFYKDGSTGRPPIDLYLPQGRLFIAEFTKTPLGDAKQTAAYLYEQKSGPIVDVANRLTGVLFALTGDLWHYTPDTVSDFNFYNSTILYNGLVSPEYSVDDPRYSYVLVIELGDLCRNLSGKLRIGYRYSSTTTPANKQFNPASATPLFQH
ncbi:hypothetical protein D3C85_149770 [compost metagenome]